MTKPNTETATENPTLKIYGREKTGKSAAFQVRRKDMIPAIVYGPNIKTPFTVKIVPNDLRIVYGQAGKSRLITLESVEGAPSELSGTKVFMKEIQAHPFKNIVTHVDLHQIDMKRKIRVVVPIKFVGKAKGLAEGGILSIVTRTVEIKALAIDIPSAIECDVSELGVNDSVHIEELAKKYEAGNAKIEFIYEANVALVAVVPPEEEVVATPTVDAAAAAVPGAPGAAPAGGAAAPGAAGAAAGGAKAGEKAPAAAKGGDKAPAKKN